MKKQTITILSVVILGTAALWFVFNNAAGTIDNALRNFAVNDTAAIDKIVLKDKTHTITLECNVNRSNWKVNGTRNANMHAVRTLLYTINKLDVKAPVGKNEEEKIKKKLMESAVKCDIYEHGKLERSYYVGGPTPDKMGTYMVLMDVETNTPAEKPFIMYVPGLNTYVSPHYFTDMNEWSDKTVFNYNQPDIKSVRVENPFNPEKNYELLINKNKYQLKMLSNNQLITITDTIAVNQYLTYFFNLKYQNSDTAKLDLSKEQLVSVITVTNITNVINKVMFYPYKVVKQNPIDNSYKYQVDPDHLIVKLNNGDIATVQLYLFGKLMQDPSYFLKR